MVCDGGKNQTLAPGALAHGASPSHSSSSSVSSGGLYFAVGATGGSTCGSEGLNPSISSHKSSPSAAVGGASPAAAARALSTDQMAAMSLEGVDASPTPSRVYQGEMGGQEASPQAVTGYALASQTSNLDTLTHQPHTFIPSSYTGSAEPGTVYCFQVITSSDLRHIIP